MNKYAPLQRYLTGIAPTTHEVILLFQELEQILGCRLPNGALMHRAWWANPTTHRDHPHAQAWLAAGWSVDTVDFNRSWVRFERQ